MYQLYGPTVFVIHKDQFELWSAAMAADYALLCIIIVLMGTKTLWIYKFHLPYKIKDLLSPLVFSFSPSFLNTL